MIGIETLAEIWDAHRAGAPAGQLVRAAGDDPRAVFYLSALAVVRGDHDEAARLARTASEAEPGHRVYRAAAQYLTGVARYGVGNVYAMPEAFTAFIRGGGNVGLYAALSNALRTRYQRRQPATLLDVGAGDGRALLPALTTGASRTANGHSDLIGHVDLVEPSATMLATVSETLRRRGTSHTAMTGTIQELIAGRAPWPPERHWALTQSTFALHNLPPGERLDVLGWIRQHTDRLLIAEFDVPAHDSCEPAWFCHVVDRYQDGLAEYDDPADSPASGAADLVAQGFLMPVMFGYFDPDNPHHEQPVAAWTADLRAAGFRTVLDPHPVYDYWWAPAYLLEATGETGR